MTKDICHKLASNKSAVLSEHKSKLIQKKKLDAKKHLVMKRLMGLGTQFVKKEEPENAIIPVISSESEKEMEITTGTQSSGVSVSAMDRALQVQANLFPQFPSFVKRMLKSHVTGGYWLGLDRKFCVSHMAHDDAIVILVDEDEKEFQTKYLSVVSHDKVSFSGGWKGFAVAKGLQEGDVVIFQLIEPRKFKVYITRAETKTELDGAVSLLNLDSHAKPIETDQVEGSECSGETENQKDEEPLVLDNCDLKSTSMLISNYDAAMDEFDTVNGDMTSCLEVLDGIRFSQRDVSFEEINEFEDFTIQVDILNLDSKIPIHLRKKYYELCSSQNMFLHENMIKGLNCDLATGVIFETINIADAIKQVKSVKKSVYDLGSWDRTLKSFAGLGMEVGFLRDRISKLLGLCQKYQAEIDSKQSERDEAEFEMGCVEAKLHSLGETVKRLDLEICDLVTYNDELDSEFKEIASARW